MTNTTYQFTDEDDDWIKVESSSSEPNTSYVRTSELGANVPTHEALKLSLAILETAGDTSGAAEYLREKIRETELLKEHLKRRNRQMEIIRPYGYTNYSSAPAVVRGLADKILELEDRNPEVGQSE